MQVKLAYGKTGLEVELPEHAKVLTPYHLPGLTDEKSKAFEALDNPIGTPPLRMMVRETDKVAIVISDMTRPTPNHKMVPWLLEALNHVPRENFVIINGTGSHRDNTPEELIQMLGEDVVNSVRVVNNNAFDKLTQVQSVDVFGDQHRRAIDIAGIVRGDDVRVAEPADGPHFRFEPLPHPRVGQAVSGQQFDCDFAAEFRVPGKKHTAHAAPAQWPYEFIFADADWQR